MEIATYSLLCNLTVSTLISQILRSVTSLDRAIIAYGDLQTRFILHSIFIKIYLTFHACSANIYCNSEAVVKKNFSFAKFWLTFIATDYLIWSIMNNDKIMATRQHGNANFHE